MTRRPIFAAMLIAGLAACSDPDFDANSQIGPNPVLPEPQQYLCSRR